MAEEAKKPRGARGARAGKAGKEDSGKADRRRLIYLKARGKELKKEVQANKDEAEALRQKLGMGSRKGRNKGEAAADDGDDE
ncbi:MAG: hypothetical protein JOZ72_01855 [Alphaproteobacteria bacterium]|nr:hypothetical protein [Alphaproteobacteria bacterium]